MKKFLVIVLFGVGFCEVYANYDELIYSTQCEYEKLVGMTIIPKKEYVEVVEKIIDTVVSLKKAGISETSADYCGYSEENGFDDNCALFLSELWDLLKGNVGNRSEEITSEVKSELIAKARRDLDKESLEMLGMSR